LHPLALGISAHVQLRAEENGHIAPSGVGSTRG